MENKRYDIIDLLKGFAIFAVVIDHTSVYLYDNYAIKALSYCSVPIFVLLAGVTSWLSFSRANIDKYEWKIVLKRLKTLLVPYALATAFCTFVNGGHIWVLQEFIYELKSFSGSSPYYFVAFFLQLVIISPVLYLIVKKINNISKTGIRVLCSVSFLLFILALSVIFTKRTFMFDLYGGGKYLFGGSYFFFYTLGMISAKKFLKWYETINLKKGVFLLLLSSIALVVYVVSVVNETGLLYLDRIFSIWTVNPPGVRIFYLAISWIVFFCAIGSLLKNHKRAEKALLGWLRVIGKRSYVIFLCHEYFMKVCREIFFAKYPIFETNMWSRRIIIAFTALLLPIIVEWLLKKVCSYINYA